MERMNRLGLTCIEVTATLLGVAVWSLGGKLVAQAVQPGGTVPPFLVDFVWPFLGATVVQFFWHISKASPARVLIGVSGAAGVFAGAMATLTQWIAGKVGYAFGADIVFMLSIVISVLIFLKGFEGVFSALEPVLAWVRGRGKKED